MDNYCLILVEAIENTDLRDFDIEGFSKESNCAFIFGLKKITFIILIYHRLPAGKPSAMPMAARQADHQSGH